MIIWRIASRSQDSLLFICGSIDHADREQLIRYKGASRYDVLIGGGHRKADVVREVAWIL